MVHMMKLNPEPFHEMISGKKKIEYRLYDDKRRMVEVGDNIIFTNTEDGSLLETDVVNITRADSFAELRTKLLNEGYLNADTDFDPAWMNKYYSKENELKYGVVGIHINVIE